MDSQKELHPKLIESRSWLAIKFEDQTFLKDEGYREAIQRIRGLLDKSPS